VKHRPRINPFADLGTMGALDESRAQGATSLRASTTGPVSHDADTVAHRMSSHESVERASHTIRYPVALGEADERELWHIRYERDGFHTRAQIRLDEDTSYYGVGEHAGPLLLNGRSHVLWNTDAYGYGANTRALYKSHPWVLAVRPNGRTIGILFDTHRRGTITCHSDGIECLFEGDPFEIVTFEAPSATDVLAGLASLIGQPPLYPRWALGYHQCRYSYMSDEEVRSIARRMRAERLPCDAIWLDIHYMDRFRVFTWDSERFADPRSLTDALRSDGLRSVAILDPGIVDDDADPTHMSAVAGDHLITTPDGDLAGGRVWPGACHFPDFTRAETRAWWTERVEQFVRESGLDGVWCDMNEPGLLGAPTRTLREDALHRGEPAGSHAEVHNLYGHLMVVATRDGAEAARPGERPFVLTRAATLATGAVAATWTGDNQSHWDDLRWSIPMVLNLGLSGQVMSGPDIGGFSGEADEELFVRWFELGAYMPFCRGHAELDTQRKEPWAFGEDATSQVRAALERRMRLLPTLASLMAVAHDRGTPPCRPVWFADPADRGLRAIDDAFLLGADLLIAPITGPGACARAVVLPSGGWYAFGGADVRLDDAKIEVDAPRGTTPVFARAGGVVVEGPVLQHTGEKDDARTLTVFLDQGGSASGTHVEDDGQGASANARIEMRAERRNGGAHVHFKVEGQPTGRAWTIIVIDDGVRSCAVVDGRGGLPARVKTLKQS